MDGCSSVLDLGAGDGEVTLSLRRDGRRLVGADLRVGNLRACRLGGSAPGDLVAADSRGWLPFAGASFDGVLMCHTLEHFSETERPAVLGEVRRVLQPQGIFMVVVPNDGISFRHFLYLDSSLARADPDHKSFFIPSSLRQALQPYFAVERIFTYPPPVIWMASPPLARRLSLGLGYNIYAVCRPPRR